MTGVTRPTLYFYCIRLYSTVFDCILTVFGKMEQRTLTNVVPSKPTLSHQLLDNFNYYNTGKKLKKIYLKIL